MQDKKFDEMNVMPLVDVMLVLLTIVLVTASFIHQGTLPLELPKAESGQKGQNPKQTQVIEMDRVGAIHFKGQPLGLPQLLNDLSSKDREGKILLRADAAAKLQDFVSLYDGLRQKGFTNLHLQVKP